MRLFGIVLIILFVLIGIVLVVHNQLEEKHDTKYKKETTEQIKANTEQNRIALEKIDRLYSEFKEFRGGKESTLSNVKGNEEKLLKYGGALYVQLSIHGIAAGGSYLLDYGDVKNFQRNRVYLYANDDKTISMVLYDVEGKEYRITSNAPITLKESHEIACVWNKNHGDIVLFVDNVERGKVSVKPLSVELVAGELAVGSNLNGTGQGALIVQQVAVFAFNA